MKRLVGLVVVLAILGSATADEPKPRARDLGIAPGILAPGELNAITDVAGVKVGHVTLREGSRFNTGVTVVVPAEGNLYQDRVPAAVFGNRKSSTLTVMKKQK